MDKLSYALGLSMGGNFIGSGIKKLDINDFADGLRAIFEGAEQKMTFDEAKQIVTDFFTNLEKQGAEQNERLGREYLEKNKDVEVWFCTSAEIREKCPEDVRIMERFGPVLADTCMVVAPIEGVFERTGTNSAKAGNYLPTLCSQKAMCRDIAALMEVVM